MSRRGGVVNDHQYSIWGVGLSEQEGGRVEEESEHRVVLKEKVREGSGRRYQSFLFQVYIPANHSILL